MADLTRIDVPSVATLRERYCQDVRRLKQRAGVANPNVAPGSETAIKGEALAAMVQQTEARNAALQDATMPDRATGEDLDRLCAVRGITRSAGAGAAGNAIVSTTGVVVFVAGLECKTDDGLRYKVVSTTAAGDGDAVPIAGVDVGKRTERVEGTTLTWSAPPAGSDATATVGPGGLVNGADADDNARLRKRLQDSLRHPAAAGTWAHYRQWAEGNAAVEAAFVYPSARGPSTVDVAYTVAATVDNGWSRIGSAALTLAVSGLIVAADPEHVDVLTQAVDETATDVCLRVTVPLPAADGGNGGGWIDDAATHWPRYYGTGVYVTTVSGAPASPTAMNVDVNNAANIPLVGASFAIWSHSAKKFVHSRVKTASLVGGTTYALTLYDAIDTSIVSDGDYISPDAENLDGYALTLLEQFATLGPGEETSTAALLPRALRHPLAAESWPSSLTSANVGQLSFSHPEVTHVAVVTPALPASPAVASPPKVLALQHFAIYKY